MGFIKDIRAAFVTGTLTIAYCLSTSALIFAGPIQPFLGYGLTAALVTAAVLAFVVSVQSGFSIAIAGPTSTIAAALAATVAAIAPALATLPDGRALPIVMTILASTTLATGATLLFIGAGRLGKAVRFIPFPVVAGFMGTSGWLLASGAIRMTMQTPMSFSSASAFANHGTDMELLLLVLWAAVLATTRIRFKGPTVVPCLLIGAVAAANVLAHAVPNGDVSAFLKDAMFHATSRSAFEIPSLASPFILFDRALMVPLIPNVLGVIVITVVTALLTCTGLEAALDLDGDLDRELKVQGTANILSALGGGFIGLISVGSTLAARAAGARNRNVGFLTAILCLLVLLGGRWLINDIPRFVVGGLQLQLGAEVLWTWCITSRRKMPIAEWLLVVGMVAIAAWFGFVLAIVCGIIGGCIVFAVDVSRINVVRRSYGVHERGSSLVRSGPESAVISQHGGIAQVVELNGYLFFGSAYQLLLYIKTLISAGCLRFLILDFTAVTGADSTSASMLVRLKKVLHKHSIVLVLAGVAGRTRDALETAGVIGSSTVLMPERDLALEHAEGQVLAEMGAPLVDAISMTAWLTQLLGRLDLAEDLASRLESSVIAPGTYLCRQGEPTDSLIFIESGRVGVTITTEKGEARVRVFGSHTIVGEQGFILERPRSASLKVEQEAQIWLLRRRSFEELAVSNVELVIALMHEIVRVQSERLSFATRQSLAMSR